MTDKERLAGWCYFGFQLIVLPEILALGNALLPKPLNVTYLNILLFVINFAVILCIFHRYLWNSLTAANRNLWRTLKSAFLAFCVYYVSNMLVNALIFRLMPSFYNVNDSSIDLMAAQNYSLMTFCVMVLVPIVEETLYRGLLFGSLYRKNHWLGYIVSVTVFALIHVVGYVGNYSLFQLFLCLLQYLPAGIALAWAYVEADTIWAPILIHMTINFLGMAAMR
jgi:membrane protease YdiL (CAAX protease family)